MIIRDFLDFDGDHTWHDFDYIQIAPHSRPTRKIGMRAFGQGERVYSIDATMPTLTAQGGGTGRGSELIDVNGMARNLSAKERCRLQGFSDTDYRVSKATITDRQICVRVGNSITVNILETIFSEVLR